MGCIRYFLLMDYIILIMIIAKMVKSFCNFYIFTVFMYFKKYTMRAILKV